MKDILRKITDQPSKEFFDTLQHAERLLKQEKARSRMTLVDGRALIFNKFKVAKQRHN
ncbi:hypothetical protein [Pseudoalteromonas piscicida]|uniref:hypothetical protein n=1 Tax=Pseudoalteromonas piscicida TaxID=43662 RepID=UPI0030B4471C